MASHNPPMVRAEALRRSAFASTQGALSHVSISSGWVRITGMALSDKNKVADDQRKSIPLRCAVIGSLSSLRAFSFKAMIVLLHSEQMGRRSLAWKFSSDSAR
jgi:hypothetical protein